MENVDQCHLQWLWLRMCRAYEQWNVGRKQSQQSSNWKLSLFLFAVGRYCDDVIHICAYLTYNNPYCVDAFTGGEMRPLSYHQNGVPLPDAGSWKRSHMDFAQQQQGLQHGYFCRWSDSSVDVLVLLFGHDIKDDWQFERSIFLIIYLFYVVPLEGFVCVCLFLH